jgi:hypothetical protein
MNEDRSRIRSYRYLIILLMLLNTACAVPKNTAIEAPIPQPLPPIAIADPTVPASSQPVRQNDEQLYQEALIKAAAAKAIGQSAASKDDWFLVASNLQGSVEINYAN